MQNQSRHPKGCMGSALTPALSRSWERERDARPGLLTSLKRGVNERRTNSLVLSSDQAVLSGSMAAMKLGPFSPESTLEVFDSSSVKFQAGGDFFGFCTIVTIQVEEPAKLGASIALNAAAGMRRRRHA